MKICNLRYIAAVAASFWIMLLSCSCSSLRYHEASADAISITAYSSPKGGRGTLSLGVLAGDFNDFCYENICKPLQKADMRAVFYGRLTTFETCASYKHPVIWERVRRLVEAGHSIGIQLEKKDLTDCSPEELFTRIDKVSDAMFEMIGTRISVLRIGNAYYSEDFLKILVRLASKYVIDDSGGWRHILDARIANHNFRDPADEVEQKGCASYYLTLYTSREFLSNMISDLKKRKIDVIPYHEMNSYRKALYTAFCRVRKEKMNDRNHLVISGECTEYPDIPVCYRVRQYEGTSVIKEDIVFLKNHETERVLLKGSVKEISTLPILSLAMLPYNKQASITITIDDTNELQAKIWYPVLKKYGLVSTHFLYMNSPLIHKLRPDWLAMQKDGFEIGCHSFLHMCKGDMLKVLKETASVGGLPPELFNEDLNKALDVISKNGLHCTSYCYPGNYHCHSNRELVGKVFPYMVWNERVTLGPNTADPNNINLYLDYLLKEHYNHVHMLHTPDYRNKKYLELYEIMFAELTKRPKIMNWTFSQQSAYLLARRNTDLIVHASDDHSISFSIGDPAAPKIPCLLPMTCQMKADSKSIERISVNGKDVSWREENGFVFFEAERGSMVTILFYKI